MGENILLVDFENVGKIDLGAIPEGVRVPFFFGASQKSVDKEFLRAALKLGDRFQLIDIEGQGKNALDFHIAFYLGEYFATSPTTRCVILSKDKGFDPLIKHLTRRKFTVRRASTLQEAFSLPKPRAATSTSAAALDEGAIKWLSEMQKNKRPRKRKGLIAHLYSHFKKQCAEADIHHLVEKWIQSRKLSDTGGSITYHL